MSIIALAGPKHCGKSTVVGVLAEMTGYPFADLDSEIERRNRKSVRELYLEGPQVFRLAEARALEAILEEAFAASAKLVLAAGGGIIDNAPAMKLLKNSDAVKLVYLDVSVEIAWSRIEKAAAQSGLPPFLQSADPRKTHRELHERRAAVYKKYADLIVDCNAKTAGEIAQAILAWIESSEQLIVL
jgi:shikimate kinase